MHVRDRIRYLSHLPERFNILLEQALLSVTDPVERRELCEVACVVSNAAWRFWLSRRPPEDNRQEHEWVVLANVMRIAEAEGLGISDRRVATAFAFTHDSFFIRRIMDHRIRGAGDEEKEKLNEEKRKQRIAHMQGGAKNAEFLLPQLRRPDSPTKPVFTWEEIRRCVRIVERHDFWKLEPPEPFKDDKLATVCLEADALWPLHPLGVLADLERPDEKGETKDFANPSVWKEQLEQSHETLLEFRPKWQKAGIPEAGSELVFQDKESIFRTVGGYELYREWRTRWGL